MKIKQFEVWIADLNHRIGTETGKIRPVLSYKTICFNYFHPSTIICPITTNVQKEAEILRVHLKKGMAKLKEDCDMLIDQIRAIDNKRLQTKLGILPAEIEEQLRQNITLILDL